MKPYVIKNGLILGLTLVAYQLIQYMFELYTNKFLGWGVYLVILLMLYYTIKSFRDIEGNGYITYGKCVALGSLTLAVSALISTITSYIYIKFIDPGITEKLIEISIVEMENSGASEMQIEQTIGILETMLSPEMMTIMGFFSYMFMGGLILLIIAAFMKKENPNPDIDSLDSGI
jgi:ABC-type multidrug transport system fused ATPase/permease subunit